MPEFIAAAEAIGGATALTGAQTYALVSTSFTIAYTSYSLTQAQRAKRAARDAALNSLQDRTVAIRSSDEPQKIIVGQSKVGGVIAFACSHGPKKEYLTLVQALAGHECEAFVGIFVNDVFMAADQFGVDGWCIPGSAYYKNTFETRVEQIVCPAPGGTVTLATAAAVIDSIAYREIVSEVSRGEQVTLVAGTDYAFTPGGTVVTLNNAAAAGQTLVITYRVSTGGPLLRVKWFAGIAAGERDTDLETASAGKWTSAHVGKGVARVHVTVKWDNDVFGAIGLPTFSPVVKGAKFYNWVNGTTTWTDNAARVSAGYMMSSSGFNIPGTRINSAYMVAAQTACDETVPISGSATEKRYTANGLLSTDADRRDNLRQLLSAMQGTAVYSAGEWLIRAGVYQAPTYTLTEDDLADAASITINPAVARRDLFNSVRGRFVSAWPTFLSTSFPPYASSTYIAQDGGQQIDADIDLPFVNSAYAAQRISKLMLFRHRLGLSFSASFKMSAWPLVPGDTVYCPWPTFGWDTMNGGLGKIFRVERASHGADGTVLLSFAEEASSVYSWSYTEATGIDPAPNSNLPDPLYVPALTGATATSDLTTYAKLSDGTVVPYAVVSWDAVTDAGILSGGIIRVLWKRVDEAEWRRLSSTPDATSVKLTPLGAGEYLNIRMWAENGIGTRSAEVTLVHQVSVDLISAVLAATNSANYIANATFSGGVALWTYGQEDGLTDPSASFTRQPDGHPYRIAGIPTNALLYQGGTQQKTNWADSSRFPVERGRNYIAFASMLPIGAAAGIQVILFDASGAVVGYGAQDVLFAQTGSPADPSAYKIVEGRMTVDTTSTAVSACLRVYKTGTNGGSATSALFVTKPQFGPIDSLTSPRPEWSASITPTVGTLQIEPNAATDTVEVKSGTSGIYTDKITGQTYVWLGKVTITNPTSTALPVIVSAVQDVQIAFTGSGVYKLGFALAEEITATVIDPQYCATVESGKRGGGTISVQRTFTLAGLTTETYYLIAVVGAGSGSLGSPSDVIYQPSRLLAQLIKR